MQSLKSIKDFELIFRSVETHTVNHLKLNHKDLSLATWFRLFIPELCFDCHRKILYMDVDIVVLKSLRELWNTDLKEEFYSLTNTIINVLILVSFPAVTGLFCLIQPSFQNN